MKSIKLKKENGETIPCLIEIPEETGDIIIMVHGFGSQKDCATAQLLFRRMPPDGWLPWCCCSIPKWKGKLQCPNCCCHRRYREPHPVR